MNLERLIFVGGILHFGILIASALVPKVRDWKDSLGKLDGLSRQLVWVHGAFIVLVIIGFGLLSVTFAGELAGGKPYRLDWRLLRRFARSPQCGLDFGAIQDKNVHLEFCGCQATGVWPSDRFRNGLRAY